MEKFTFILLFSLSLFTSAQCTISGKASINENAEETYAVGNDTAQCKDCHLWVGIGGNAMILGDNKQNTVKIKATSGGRQVLSLVYLTSQGVVQCSKNIDINGKPSTATNNTKITPDPEPVADCNIHISEMKEVKVADNMVLFQPVGEDNSYKFNWTVTYFNGKVVASKEKNPQFSFGKADGIKKVQVKIISTRCMREFTKTFDTDYWMYF